MLQAQLRLCHLAQPLPGLEQLTPRIRTLGKGTRSVLGRDKNLISFRCTILDKTVPQFLLFVLPAG